MHQNETLVGESSKRRHRLASFANGCLVEQTSQARPDKQDLGSKVNSFSKEALEMLDAYITHLPTLFNQHWVYYENYI